MSDNTSPERAPRWPNDRNFSPTVLKTYGQCASRVKMQYVQKLEGPDKWIRAYALGRPTHQALKIIARQLSVGADGSVTDEQIRDFCRFEIPRKEYSSDEAHEADIQQVIRWVRKGESWLKALHVEEWLRIEQFERRNFTMFPAKVPFSMVTSPDLVMKQIDEDGQPYFHIVDWKTGSVWEEPDVPVIMRFALREKLQEWTGDANAANVKFTWYWLDHDYRKQVDVSMEQVDYVWPGVVNQMKSLATEQDWIATPGYHCNFCPYYKNYCPEEIPPQRD